MAFENELALLAVGEESTPGVAVATAAAVRLRSLEATPSIEMTGDKMATGDFGQSELYSGERTIGFKGMGYLSLPPALITAADWMPLFYGCGFVRTVHGSTGQSLALRIAGANTSLTLRHLDKESGPTPRQRAMIGVGCMGSLKISAGKRGDPFKYDLDYKGGYTSDADVSNGSLVSQSSANTTYGLQLVGWLATLHGIACRIDSIEIDYGQDVQPLPNQGKADLTGVECFRVTGAAPKIKLSVEVPLVATMDIRSRWANMTTGSFIMSNQGSGASLMQFRFPVVQIKDAKYKDNSKARYVDLELHAQRNGSADATMNAEDMCEILHGSKT